MQGGLGNCYIHAAAATLANKSPQAVRNVFKTQSLNTAGVYALQLYTMGLPVTITVDEYLAFEKECSWCDSDTLKPTYAEVPRDGAIWNLILEKAIAKLYGNYELLEGGTMGNVISALTGAPYF